MTIRIFTHDSQRNCFRYGSYSIEHVLYYMVAETYLVIFRHLAQKKIHIRVKYGHLYMRYIDITDI